MADTTLPPDLTLLSGDITEMRRDLRLLRLQVDNVAARLATHDGRFTAADTRMASIEQSIHDMLNEMSRGFGQQSQQLTRIERQQGVLRAGLGEIKTLLTDFLARG